MADKDKGTFERIGSSAGGLAGKAGDTAVNLMGSMIRTVAGTVGGWWTDRTPDKALATFGEREDRACRTHFENTRRGSSYDTVRPLYQFGHLAGQNPDYQGRSFEDVEVDLRSAWSPDQARTHGDWDSVRDYVNTGYMTHSRGGNLP
ncbi:MAG: hypothetical protein ACT4O1_13700 [Gemmatimonadota bacterium]